MIPNIGELAVLMSRWDANQQRKNKWKQSRYEALDYYNGNTKEYVGDYFNESMLKKIVTGNVNITKRIIDRISLVYMVSPKRTYSKEDIVDAFKQKDMKLQRLERMTNLLDGVLFKPCWRIDDNGGHIEYDIIFDYEPIFHGDDPMKPDGYVYPLNLKSSVMSNEAERFAYWDKENHFIFDRNSKVYSNEDNPDMINPYGVLPFIESYRDGKPEYNYMDTDACIDLIQTNLAINVAETNKNANVMFQSFGYLYVNGAGIDTQDTMQVGQDKINYLGVDGTINIVAPPNSVPALDESIKSGYKMLSQNYHLPTSFVEGTTAESGVALRLRNQELQDDRKSDITKWRDFEMQLFELERVMVAVEEGKDAGELEDVDFDESTEILSNQEQREKWDWELSHNLIDEADIMTQINPDLTREEALEYLAERKIAPVAEETAGSSLLQALAKPVE
tara:strand:+ start:8074 stop:9417 length:1344 start_codon:yes stop_codon:yes gene_type:complete